MLLILENFTVDTKLKRQKAVGYAHLLKVMRILKMDPFYYDVTIKQTACSGIPLLTLEKSYHLKSSWHVAKIVTPRGQIRVVSYRTGVNVCFQSKTEAIMNHVKHLRWGFLGKKLTLC